MIAFTALVVDWPVFLAGIQIATVDVLEGRKVRLGELLRRTANFSAVCPAQSYCLRELFSLYRHSGRHYPKSLPATIQRFSPLFWRSSFWRVQVIMVARLWVNFLFWQQSAYISNLEGVDALRESKLLARSSAGRASRPALFGRGALLVSSGS